jgi:hypothetical protein
LSVSIKRWTLALALPVLMATPSAQASFKDGNQLAMDCSSGAAADSAYCAGYLASAVDAHPVVGQYEGRICMSPDVALGQVRDVVLNFMKEKPELRHHVAASIVFEALAEAFPS